MRGTWIMLVGAMVAGMLASGSPSAAQAAAESGFGVYGGLARHSSKGEFTQVPLDGVEFEFTSTGVSYGIDYQFAISDSFSLNPFIMSSYEQFEEESDLFSGFGLDAEDGRHDILGLQLRVWFGDLFVGGHVGVYTEVINFSNSNGPDDDAGFAGSGLGAVVGWEDDGGLFFTGQVDAATLDSDDDEATTDITGVRVHAGFRFK